MVTLALNVAAFLFLAWLGLMVGGFLLTALGCTIKVLPSVFKSVISDIKKGFKKLPANAANR